MLTRVTFFVLIAFSVAACEAITDVTVINSRPTQWLLPSALSEASGLAPAANNTVYLHNDELGEIYRFNPRTNSIFKVASISWPPVGEDFEGIAGYGTSLFLVTSDSRLFEIRDFAPREDHQVVGARRISTGLENQCEFEGLYNLAGKLLMPCKESKSDRNPNLFRVFAYDIKTEKVSKFLELDPDKIEGVEIVAATAFEANSTHYFVVSENYLITIDRDTLNGEAIKLSSELHKQVEGITFLDDGTVIVVEDNRRGLARLTQYASLEELISLNL